MSKVKKIILILVMIVIGTGIMLVADWYRFTLWGSIDSRRGVYGNPHLEIWIDINARMPAPVRQWACRVLREREKQVLGGQNTLPFYSCQPDFGLYPTPASRAEAILRSMAHGATASAIRRGAATEGQKPALVACIASALDQRISAEQRTALNDNKLTADILVPLNAASHAASQDCLAKAAR
ncbi:MAG: hypothetical protein ACRCTD_06350 [Beijerinckiaceae bacterium]